MDLDLFLALPRWEILQIIANKPSSPIEIAEKTKTTVSYVSQQLKLLEAKDVVKKQKTGAFEKGQPRNLFSLTEEFMHITVLANNFTDKTKIILDDKKKAILRIWFLKEVFDKHSLEKLVLLLEETLKKVDYIFLDSSKKSLTLVIGSEKSDIKDEFDKIIKKYNLDINIKWFSSNNFEVLSSYYLIYDSFGFKKEREMKGGDKNERD
jgi:DNA-binding transcriptional regulator GbsR (MarR family)